MGIVFGKIGVEMAAHDVVRVLTPTVQIRKYHPCVMAETPSGGLDSKDNSAAFNRLAKYIGVFGKANNEGKSTIAMTAPVVSTGGVSAGEKVAMTAPVVNVPGKMAFVLPSKYKSVDEAPKPLDPQITLRQVGPRTAAVLTFSGRANDAIVETRAAELAAVLAKEGVAPAHTDEGSSVPTYEVMRYNPPFTITAFRTNEIFMEVSSAGDEQSSAGG